MMRRRRKDVITRTIEMEVEQVRRFRQGLLWSRDDVCDAGLLAKKDQSSESSIFFEKRQSDVGKISCNSSDVRWTDLGDDLNAICIKKNVYFT